MGRAATLTSLVLAAALLTGCGTGPGEPDDGPVSGNVMGTPFTFASGFAGPSSSDPDVWRVYLFPVAPASGFEAWESGAYAGVFPYLDFSFDAALVPTTFEVETHAGIAQGANGDKIGINGWTGTFDNILFDSGTLAIERFDRPGGVVSGWINATTREENGRLDGQFSVEIDPALR